MQDGLIVVTFCVGAIAMILLAIMAVAVSVVTVAGWWNGCWRDWRDFRKTYRNIDEWFAFCSVRDLYNIRPDYVGSIALREEIGAWCDSKLASWYDEDKDDES